MLRCSICGDRRRLLSGTLHSSLEVLVNHVERIDIMRRFLPYLHPEQVENLRPHLSVVRRRAGTWVNRLHPGVHGDRQASDAFLDFVRGSPEGESFEQLVVDAVAVDALGLNLIAETLEAEPHQQERFLTLMEAKGGIGMLGKI